MLEPPHAPRATARGSEPSRCRRSTSRRGRPCHGSSNAGSGSGISSRLRNSNGAPSASPSASPRTQPTTRSRRSSTGPEPTEPVRSKASGSLTDLDGQDRTQAPHVQTCRRPTVRAPQLSCQQAALSPRPARPRTQADLRVPDAPGREAEDARDLRGGRAADAQVLRARAPLDGRDRRGAPEAARDAGSTRSSFVSGSPSRSTRPASSSPTATSCSTAAASTSRAPR